MHGSQKDREMAGSASELIHEVFYRAPNQKNIQALFDAMDME